ncbi:unnamed protein product, partial [marine sediment metagenome]
IKQLRIPHVSRVGYSPALAPYGLYGIEGNYKNGRVQLFVIDHGDAITPLFADFVPREKS